MHKETEQTNAAAQRQPPGSHSREHPYAADGRSHPILRLQKAAGNQAMIGLLEAKLNGSYPDQVSHSPSSPVMSVGGPSLQRSPKEGSSQPAEKTGDQQQPSQQTSAALIVADDAESVGNGQMRKSDFLSQLRTEVCATAEVALAQAGQTVAGCPYVEKWFSYYAEQDPAHIERALRKYAPEAADAASAQEYIPAVSNRVRTAIEHWARTGEITGVPDELAGLLPGAGLSELGDMIGGAFSTIFSAIGGALSSAFEAIGGFFSSIGRALFKPKDGHTGAANDPQQIQAQLIGGQPLDGGVSSRMGAAFGRDFSSVRVHTNSKAAGLSDSLNARAFTIGSDIAFGAGEYQPGTLIGDALLAHELAHVAQQQGVVQTAERGPATESQALESEADDAAVDAVLSVWTGQPQAPSIGQRFLPALKTGLRLQRCGGPYSAAELKSYLEKLGKGGVQGGIFDDNRARGVVKLWKGGAKDFNLTPRLKFLLIKEMLEGSTGDEDERAILDLLELSDNGDLRMIFLKEGLTPEELDKKFDGDNLKRLQGFYEARIEGGRPELALKHVTPKGSPKEGAPRFEYSWANLEQRIFDIRYLPVDIAEYVRSLPPDQQAKALADLNTKRAEQQRKIEAVNKLIEEKGKAYAASTNQPLDKINPFDYAGNEMIALQTNIYKAQDVEAVLNAFGLETARLGTGAATAQARAVSSAEAKTSLKPPVPTTAGGVAATFEKKEEYENELRSVMKQLINDYHKTYVQSVSSVNRADPAQLYPLERLAQIANAGRSAVDEVFSAWGTGPEFVPGVNLIDRFAEVEKKVGDIPAVDRPEALKEIARSEIRKRMSAEKGVRALNAKYNASPAFDDTGTALNDEAKIQVKITDELAATDAQRILEIIRGWPGSHREGQIKLQTPKKAAGAEERRYFWWLFQATIHEYIHSLMNGDYRTFAESFDPKGKSREFNTLVEGVASVLHEMVWQSVQGKLKSGKIRDDVEGPYAAQAFDQSVIPDIRAIRYGSYEEAQALIARVGIGNLLLAFFKGRVDLIGG